TTKPNPLRKLVRTPRTRATSLRRTEVASAKVAGKKAARNAPMRLSLKTLKPIFCTLSTTGAFLAVVRFIFGLYFFELFFLFVDGFLLFFDFFFEALSFFFGLILLLAQIVALFRKLPPLFAESLDLGLQFVAGFSQTPALVFKFLR